MWGVAGDSRARDPNLLTATRLNQPERVYREASHDKEPFRTKNRPTWEEDLLKDVCDKGRYPSYIR